MEVLTKKAGNEEVKIIEIAIKIEERAKKNIENATKKKQNLKCKAVLTSINRPFKNKKQKKLNNPLAKISAKETDTVNDQSQIPSSLSGLSGLSPGLLGFLGSIFGLSLFAVLDIYLLSRLKLSQLSRTELMDLLKAIPFKR